MYVHTRAVSKLTPDVYGALYKLNFRSGGQMQTVLRHFYREDSGTGHARVFWIEDGGQIVSWALVFAYSANRKKTAYFYTRKTHRHRGLATKLMREVTKRYPSVEVHPHDERASGFFGKFKTRQIRRVKYY